MIANPHGAADRDDRRHARHVSFVSRSQTAAFCGLLLLTIMAFPAAGDPVGDVVIEGEIVAQPAFVQPALPNEVFDQWVYGAGRTAAGGRSRLDTLLQIRIDDVERTCGATAAQRNKLALAGRGDIERFNERVDAVRKKFESIRNNLNRVNEIHRDLQPLQAELGKGLFGDGSLYAKTLKKTLSAEQVERCTRADRERRRFALQAEIEMTTAALGNALGLRAEQRDKLAGLLLEELRFVAQRGAVQTQLVLFQISRIPEERLKPLFDPGQWRILSGQLVQARRLEPMLRQSGLLPEKETADEKSEK